MFVFGLFSKKKAQLLFIYVHMRACRYTWKNIFVYYKVKKWKWFWSSSSFLYFKSYRLNKQKKAKQTLNNHLPDLLSNFSHLSIFGTSHFHSFITTLFISLFHSFYLCCFTSFSIHLIFLQHGFSFALSVSSGWQLFFKLLLFDIHWEPGTRKPGIKCYSFYSL